MNNNNDYSDLSAVLSHVGIADNNSLHLPEVTRQRLAECVEKHLIDYVNCVPDPMVNVPCFYPEHMCISDIRSVYSTIVRLAVRSTFGFVNNDVAGRMTKDLVPAYEHVVSKFSDERHLVAELTNELKKIFADMDKDTPQNVNRVALWDYRPIESKTEPHSEYESCTEDLNGFTVTGARVRGKSHKHAGTNCDDYFQVGHSGSWNIIAVSDGAGSKKFSRIGAKVATTGVVEYLKQVLTNVDPAKAEFTKDPYGHIDAGEFFTDSHNVVADAYLHAEKLVVSVCEEKRTSVESADYKAETGHELEPNDFACTLLIAIQTRILVDGELHDIVFAGQVGDGLICLKSKSGTVQVIGQPDSGGFSGETEFITSSKMKLRESLMQRINPWVGSLSMLAVMTDGVADDYFPAKEMVPALFCDLILNGVVLPDTGPSELEQVDSDLSDKYVVEVESISEQPVSRKIASSKALSDCLLTTPSKLLQKDSSIERFVLSDSEVKPHERLCNWLDLYQVRGSADDRTLVLLTTGNI